MAVTQKFLIVTANYAARSAGLKVDEHKGAKALCPEVALVSGEDLTPYRACAKKVRAALERFGTCEKLGLDECWVGLTAEVDRRIATGGPASDPPLVGHRHSSTHVVESDNAHRPTDIRAVDPGRTNDDGTGRVHAPSLHPGGGGDGADRFEMDRDGPGRGGPGHVGRRLRVGAAIAARPGTRCEARPAFRCPPASRTTRCSPSWRRVCTSRTIRQRCQRRLGPVNRRLSRALPCVGRSAERSCSTAAFAPRRTFDASGSKSVRWLGPRVRHRDYLTACGGWTGRR